MRTKSSIAQGLRLAGLGVVTAWAALAVITWPRPTHARGLNQPAASGRTQPHSGPIAPLFGSSQALYPIGFGGVQIAVGSDPIGVVAADFNRDGRLDLAVANNNNLPDGTVSILLGNGDGTFQSRVDYSTGPASGPLYLAVGDFNGDGNPDLVVADDSSGGVSVLLGNGDGTFQAHKDLFVGGSPYWVAVGDFNHDGKLDVAVANQQLVYVALGNGDGTFGLPVAYTTANDPTTLTVADFNGDGNLDLAVVASTANVVSVLLGNGDGTFRPRVDYATGTNPNSIVTADFNGDGKLDLAVLNTGASSISVLLGNGDGTFQPHQDFPSALGPAQLILGDFNSDGKLDLATVDACDSDPTCALTTSGTVSVMLGNGDGTFGTHLDYPTGNVEPGGIAAGDFNADGKLDLAAPAGNTVAVLLQTTAILSPGVLTFPAQAAGTTSPPQTVALTNSASTTLSISGITVTGGNSTDYAETNTCGTSLAAGASCTLSVTFTPTAEGTRSTLVTVQDDAVGSPQQVALTGTGSAPVVFLNPTSLSFPTQLVGTTSALQRVGLTNSGNAALNITGITVSGDFLERNNCGASLAAGASCTITVQFRPKGANTRTGAVTLTDNATNSPQTLPLTGLGTFFSLSPASLNFGSVPVGSTSAAETATLTNVAKVSQTIFVIRLSGADPGDFAETNTCGPSLPAGGSCTFSVTFTPTAKGSRSASLQVSGGGGGAKSTTLTGTGT